MYIFLFLVLIGLYLIYSVVKPSAVQQSEPAIHIHIAPFL